EQRLLVLERVQVEVERQGIDRALAGIGPGQSFTGCDLMVHGVEPSLELVVGDARRARRSTAAQRGATVDLRHQPRPGRTAITAARGGDERDDNNGAKHARLYHNAGG